MSYLENDCNNSTKKFCIHPDFLGVIALSSLLFALFILYVVLFELVWDY